MDFKKLRMRNKKILSEFYGVNYYRQLSFTPASFQSAALKCLGKNNLLSSLVS